MKNRHTIGIPSSLRSFSPICFKAVISTCIINPINQRFAGRYSIVYHWKHLESTNMKIWTSTNKTLIKKNISYIWRWQQKSEAKFTDQKLYKRLNHAYIENLFTFMKAIVNILRRESVWECSKQWNYCWWRRRNNWNTSLRHQWERINLLSKGTEYFT